MAVSSDLPLTIHPSAPVIYPEAYLVPTWLGVKKTYCGRVPASASDQKAALSFTFAQRDALVAKLLKERKGTYFLRFSAVDRPHGGDRERERWAERVRSKVREKQRG